MIKHETHGLGPGKTNLSDLMALRCKASSNSSLVASMVEIGLAVDPVPVIKTDQEPLQSL